ncbi:MAG: hypothetical protein IJ033_06170 [Clostridia bacterium]|nr:hypothetical protein [Clostridia bacterium]
MKKIFVSVLLVICLALTSVALFACNDNTDDGANDFVAPSFDYTLPTDIAEYGLSIEWIGSDGNPTTFKSNRPTAIVIGGASEYNVKDGINLDTTDYTASVMASSVSLQKTSYLWNRQGFNIGVFHYENFADDTNDNIVKKIFNSSSMTYINKDGNTVTTTPDFNLTEAFISAYLKVASSDELAYSGGKYIQEVRFIGNGVGAILALSAAEYLDYLYENGAVGVGYLPDRIDLIDPYLSNTGSATVVDFYSQTTLGSALEFGSSAVAELAPKGTVFTLVESDKEYYDSYENRYSGVSVIDNTVTLTESGDSALYLAIKKNVAYLNFSESFSAKMSETYQAKERTTLDWFLYTVNGSDSTSITTQSETDIRPMVDGYNMMGTSVSTSVKYAVSAWTPTVYLRAVRGHEYNMAKYSSTTQATTSYTMERFQAESYQISDLTLDNAYAVCGYVYLKGDDTYFINLNRNQYLQDVVINITATVDDKVATYQVKTSSDGFYFYNLGRSMLGASVTISATTPSKDYSYTTTDASSSSNYKHLSKNMISTAGGVNTTLSSTATQNFFLYFCSCALTK